MLPKQFSSEKRQCGGDTFNAVEANIDAIVTGKTASDRRSPRAWHGERDVFRNLRDPHSTTDNRGGAKVDDFVCAFQYHDEAAQFQQALEERLGKFQLALAPEKTRSFRFNRFFIGGEQFDFLVFTYRWGKNSKGAPQVWQKTARDRFRGALKRLKEWLRKARNLPMKELMKTLKSKYRGHRNYYGVVRNKHLLDSFEHFATGIVFKWLNRRSQRRSYNWQGFRQALIRYGLGEENIEKIAA